MLDAPSMVSCSSSSSSDSSASESIMALPLPILDMLISTVLQDTSEVPEAETAHQAEPVETVPRTDISTNMFLYIFLMCCQLLSLTLVAQVLMMVVVATLAFIKWFRDHHRQG
jgi:Na+/glutamate symporter